MNEEFEMASRELQPLDELQPNWLYLGEHTRIIDKLQNLKDNYNLEGPCSVTRTLKWSPGTKKTMKLGLDKLLADNGLKNPLRAKTISRMMDYQYNRWRTDNYITTCIQIEDMVMSARDMGLTLDSSEELAQEVWQEFIVKSRQMPISPPLYRTNSLLATTREGRYHSTRRDVPFVTFLVDIPGVSMSLISGDDEIVGRVPYGDISVYLEVDLYWWLNLLMMQKVKKQDHILYRNVRHMSNKACILQIAFTKPYEKGILHPFVSRNGYRQGNICFGSLETSIYQSLMNLNGDLLVDLMHRWASTYHMRDSGPLNHINRTVIGFNKSWPDSLKSRLAVDFHTCSDVFTLGYADKPKEMKAKYCDNCQLTARCNIYAENMDTEMLDIHDEAEEFLARIAQHHEFGPFTFKIDEDVYPMYRKDVTWEDGANLEDYLENLLHSELDFDRYCYFKYGLPRDMEELSEMNVKGQSFTRQSVIDAKWGVWNNEYKQLKVETIKDIITTYQQIHNVNQRREDG